MKKRVFTLILASFLLVGVVLVIYLFNSAQRPLNPQLTLEPRPSTIASYTEEGIIPSPAPVITPTVKPSNSGGGKVCGQSGAYTVLIIGSDAADRRGRPGSDLTRLARVDFPDKKVSILALPRGLWVDVSGLRLQTPRITKTALGMAYYEAYKRSVEVEESGRMVDGAQASAQAILDNFGVSINHYLVVDLSQLPELVDAIDGLPIDIPERTTDPWIGMVIEAGPQTLSGDQLMAYARAIPDSDFGRIQRNNIILHALRQKLLHPSVWIELSTLYNQFRDAFVTDLSPQQIVSLFCLLGEVPREEIVMEQVKPEWTSPGPSNSLLWDKGKVFSALERLDLLP